MLNDMINIYNDKHNIIILYLLFQIIIDYTYIYY